MNPNFPRNLAIQPSSPTSVLAYFTSEILDSEPKNSAEDDETVIVSQNIDIKSYGIAGRIWEAAYAMKFFIDPPATLEFDPPCSLSLREGAVVELGAGTGYLGFKLARILSQQQGSSNISPKTLMLTDLEAVCPLLKRNRDQEVDPGTNLLGVDLLIQPLEWGNMEHGRRIAAELTPGVSSATTVPTGALLSHIVCSDLVYFPELLAPLLRTLLQLSSPPFSTAARPVEVIISYMIRSLLKEAPFWSAFGTWFDFLPVLVRNKSALAADWERFGSRGDGTIFIFVATRKPESLAQTVPNDVELMGGSDDTFETMLLMNMSGED